MFTRSQTYLTATMILALVTAACADDPRGDPAAPEPAVVGENATASVEMLKNRALPVLWTGTVQRDDAPSGEVPECAAVACQRFDLDLRLPPGTWNQKPGGLQVALRWAGFGNNLDLYVYHDGSRVGASDGIVATAQSLLVPMADNGRYEVYVAYDFDMSNEFGTPTSPAIDFEALAEVEYSPRAHPPRPLLPDLAARPQRNVTFEVPPPIFFEAGVGTFCSGTRSGTSRAARTSKSTSPTPPPARTLGRSR